MNGPLALSLLLSLLITTSINSQELNIKIYDEQIGDQEIVVYGDNTELFPVSIELNLELKGLQTNHHAGDIIVLEANKNKQILARLFAKPGKAWSFRTSAKSSFGNVLVEQYDTNYIYELPFAAGNEEFISQGYLGKVSHHDEYALDFNMREGTPVLAIRDGLVVKVVDVHNKSCPNPSCMKFNNFITIQHNDGTYADYAHLKQNSAQVKVGDQVQIGMQIAQSGKTGWTTGPHLHLAVFLPSLNKRKTIPTLFRISEGKSAYLQAGESYRHP